MRAADCKAALEADAVPILTATLVHHGASPAVMMSGLAALLQLAAHSHGRAHSCGQCPAMPAFIAQDKKNQLY